LAPSIRELKTLGYNKEEMIKQTLALIHLESEITKREQEILGNI
jgi:hypothetical protein